MNHNDTLVPTLQKALVDADSGQEQQRVIFFYQAYGQKFATVSHWSNSEMEIHMLFKAFLQLTMSS